MAEDDKKQDSDGEEEATKKGPGGKLFLIIGLVGGLAIGGGTAYFLATMGGDEDTTHEEVEEEPETEEKIDLVYVDIKRLPAPVLDEKGKVLGYIFLDISLETESGENQDYIFDRLPRLRDAFIREISNGRISKPGQPGVIDFERLRERFRTMANETVGKDIVLGVLIPNATHFSQ